MTLIEFRSKLFDLWIEADNDDDGYLENSKAHPDNVRAFCSAAEDLLLALGMRRDDVNHEYTFAPELPKRLRWRDVFAPKRPYENTRLQAIAANSAGYQYMVYEGTVYLVWGDADNLNYRDTDMLESEIE